jgi:hypothetical protein
LSKFWPYFNDLIIAASSIEEHNAIIQRVFERARQYNIRFNEEKLQYQKSEVHFFGVILNSEGVQINPIVFSTTNK